MNISDDFIRLGCINRPGYKRSSTRGLIIHYIGVAQHSAKVIRDNFENTTRYGATQYVCDYDTGEIIKCMPEEEVAYHCGANAYRPLKNQICGNDNPNYYLVGIETCIDSVENSRPSNVQWDALVEFSADFLKRHGLGVENLYLHNEIAPTSCYKYFIDNQSQWQEFKNNVQNKLNPVEEKLSEEEKVMIEQLRNEVQSLRNEVQELKNMIRGNTVQVPVQSNVRKFKVTASIGLNLRKDHNTNSAKVRGAVCGEILEIVETYQGSQYLWGKTTDGLWGALSAATVQI